MLQSICGQEDYQVEIMWAQACRNNFPGNMGRTAGPGARSNLRLFLWIQILTKHDAVAVGCGDHEFPHAPGFAFWG